MGYPPKIGRAVTSAAEELTQAPEPKLLGSIDTNTIERKTPSFEEDGPPPWETDPRYYKHETDARRFVDVPETWELRWLNPKQIDHDGWRDWQAVPANHDRVKVKNSSMIGPDNTIRRGGHQGGMILAYMPKTWVESRKKIKADRVRKMTQSAVDRQRETAEQIRSGGYGPYVKMDSYRHPTHTMGDGATMVD